MDRIHAVLLETKESEYLSIKKQAITLRHKAYADLAVGRCNAIGSNDG